MWWSTVLAVLVLGLPAKSQNRVLVRFHPSVNAAGRTFAAHKVGGLGRQALGRLPVEVIYLAGNADGDVAVRQLARSGRVLWAERDEIAPAQATPNDPGYPQQWWLGAVQAPTAWDTTTGSAAVTVAILDTGCDPTHPDLAPNYVAGWNFVDGNADTSDVQGHGTAVAGCVGAVGNNGIGIASVSWASKLMPVRIAFNQNGGAYAYWSTVAAGMQWAVDHGARVENCSYVGLAGSSAIRTAAGYVRSNGASFVACAGNDNLDPGFPASADIIIVSATTSANVRASFSDFGAFVTVAAPGYYVYTTTRGGGYGNWNGTSFSSPITCGVLALEYAVAPMLTPDQARQALISSCVDLGTAGWDQYYGYGLVNAAGAVQAALTLPPPPPSPPPPPADTTPPVCSITSPADGASVGPKPFTVSVAASDNVGVVSVAVSASGGGSKTDTASPWSVSFNPRRWTRGAHTITAYATDAAGLISQPVTITVYR